MSYGGTSAHLAASGLPAIVRAAAESAAATSWPPLHQGRPDTARLHWLTHRALLATELTLAPGAATIVARRLG
jgi:hypothetical protein